MHANKQITIGHKTIALDEDGFLSDPNDWSPQVAEYFSSADGVLLTEAHWQVIHFARDYYKAFGIGPMPKVIVKKLNRQLGRDKYSIKMLYSLFPDTPARRICRYAGTPQPSGCT